MPMYCTTGTEKAMFSLSEYSNKNKIKYL